MLDMLDIPDAITRIRHAYLADPDSPRIVDAMPHLDAALCVLLACDPREARNSDPAPQCSRCGDTAPPTLDSIDGNRYRYRCGAGCGHTTPWSENAEDIREEFYK